jgi:hypothetical protein
MKNETLKRGQFTFYASFYDAVAQLPKSRRYEALSAIIRYGLEGETPETLTGCAAGVFSAVRPILDNARTKAANRMRRDEAKDKPELPPAGPM